MGHLDRFRTWTIWRLILPNLDYIVLLCHSPLSADAVIAHEKARGLVITQFTGSGSNAGIDQ